MKRRAIVLIIVICSLMVLKLLAAQREQDDLMAMATDVSGQSPSADPIPQEHQELAATSQSMHQHDLRGGAHMRMTTLRPAQPGDADQAQQIVVAARKAMEKYQDYHVALDEGYKIFMPNVPQPQYHFTNYMYAFEAGFRFNAEHPTSLLYDKTPDGGYKLAGVMYTAPYTAKEDELNARVPLSQAQWHLHTNFCFPGARAKAEDANAPNPKFGMRGSITTKEACDAAGGRFMPHLFGWMIHVYPNEKTPEAIWALGEEHNHLHAGMAGMPGMTPDAHAGHSH